MRSADPHQNFYRPDVDGLRALAVLPVIFFHAGFSCPGGFIGVDAFFVISGYLITQIIERELRAHRFSIFVFYQRRVRRILPALFGMFAAAIAAAFLLLPPTELKAFGETLVASSAFSSNILFFRWSGYFAPSSEQTPFLHTWTLSLEEQFYVCWPLFLAVLSKPATSKWKIPATLTVLVGTLILSVHWVGSNPNAAFYLLPSRAWELALGALLSFSAVSRVVARAPRALASVISLTGIGLLVLAVTWFGKTTPFPGIAALLPCVGAALIIAAGEGGPSIGGRILSLRPLVWVGMISYSLYLWHWPILVFGRVFANRMLSTFERIGLVVVIFVIAWLSWRFVETPFRRAHVVAAKVRSWVIGGLATSAVFVVVGLVLYLGDGLPARGADVGDLAKEAESLQTSACLARAASLPPVEGCLLGAPTVASRYQLILWGDSHAAHLVPVLREIGRQLGLVTRQITKAGCPPIPGVQFSPFDPTRADCGEFNDAALQAVLAEKEARVVIFAARWDVYATGSLRLSLDGRQATTETSRRLFVDRLRQVLVTLTNSGRRIIVVGQVPLPPTEAVTCVGRAHFRGLDENRCATDESKDRAQTEAQVNELLTEAVSHLEPAIEMVHPYAYLCPNQGCMIESDRQLLYLDESHLSAKGARLVGDGLEKCITSALIAASEP